MAATPPPRIDRGMIAARLAAIFIGLIGCLGGLIIGALKGFGAPQLAGIYVLLTLFIWGLNGFFFRRLALGIPSLLLFSLALFGVLFLIGYFHAVVVAPWLS